jgi:sugar (pentulose or hexulose) kinase
MSVGDVVVGVDIGTTSTKVLVVGAAGAEVAEHRVATTWTERSGWSEISAEALVAATLTAVGGALAAAAAVLGRTPQVAGIGVCGMGESGVLLDGDGSARAPVIAWFDPRGADELAALPAAVRDAYAATTGLPVSPLSTLAKLLWLREAGVRLDAGCWLNVPEYVAHRLGADRAAEPSLASRTGLLDQATGTPWLPSLDALGVGPDLLPPLLPAGTDLGRVEGDDLPRGLAGATVVVAGHDHPAASFGAGAWGPEDLFDSCGTAESVLRVVSRPLTGEQRAALVVSGLTVGSHVLEDRQVVAGPTKAGIVMRRVLAMLGATEGAARDALDAAWVADPRGAGVTVSGAAMTDAEVVLRAVGDGITPVDVWAAALTHVSATVSALVASIDARVGPRKAVVAAGGWTRMASVRGQKLLSLPDVTFSPRQQAGAFGAATFAAWAAAGRTGTAVDFATGFVPAAAQPHAEGTATAGTTRRHHTAPSQGALA